MNYIIGLTQMAKQFILILSVFFALEASSQDIANWVRIDCGSPISYQDNKGLMWQSDEGYIKTGISANVTLNESSMLYEFHDKLQTLRFFPDQNKNCYTVPAPASGRYFLRAMFYYGNYDNLSTPPEFDLEFNGNKWGNVQTEIDQVVYYELMYTSRGRNTSVCLARKERDQVPFISLLESWQLPASAYASMSTSVAWFSRYRYAYGAENPYYYIQGYPDDNLNRIWYSYTPDSAQQTNASFTSLDSNCPNQPPLKAMLQAIEAPSPGYFLDLPLPFIEYTKYYDSVQLYFTEVLQDSGTNREFVGQVNLASLGTISPLYRKCTSVSYGEDGLSVGLWDVEFSSTYGSRPPIVSAIEVYTAVSVIAAGTSQDDLDGLAVFVSSFEQLRGWSGEPCLPSDTAWQWLGCSRNDPPRVTSIDLSGYNLSGPIPNFSQMKALQRIDMSNNNLNGSVPEFIGNLPDLQNLDLNNNKLSGKVPQSISQNKRLNYRFQGNPDLDQPNGNSDSKKTDHALIIGLAIGLPAALLMIFAALVLVIFSRRKQAAVSQSQTSVGNPQVQSTAGPPNGLSQTVELQSQAASGPNSNVPPDGNPHQDVDTEILELLRQRASGQGA